MGIDGSGKRERQVALKPVIAVFSEFFLGIGVGTSPAKITAVELLWAETSTFFVFLPAGG